MKKITGYIITAAVFVALGYVAGMSNLLKIGLLNGQKINHSDTTTVVVYDTLRVVLPSASAEHTMPRPFITKRVPVLLAITDTMRVPYYVDSTLVVPIRQREYAGDNYRAFVSGFDPHLDSINIFAPRTTQYVEHYTEPRNAFSVNTAAGMTYTQAAAVYAGMSLQYQRRDAFGIEVTAGITAGAQQKAGFYVNAQLSVPIFYRAW
jgi:hypothetical protein